MKADEPHVAEATVDRRLAVLRAIALHPGAGPDALRGLLAADPVHGRTWSKATLYADIKALKAHGLLDEGRHRQGYHLVGAGFPTDELHVLLNGLRMQAEDLANPLACELYDKLGRRAGHNRAEQAYLELPEVAIANRPVVRTTTDAFSDVMAHLREPLLRGQQVEIRLTRSPWARGKRTQRCITAYPLQFVFHDVAWYVLAEDALAHRFMALRVDRINPAIHVLDAPARGSAAQAERQARAWRLLRRGWGMALPAHDAHGEPTAPIERYVLRFSPVVKAFIDENHKRHDTQRTRALADGGVLFSVDLPRDPSVAFHFRRWVLTWGAAVEVLAPARLRRKLAGELATLAARYALAAPDPERLA